MEGFHYVDIFSTKGLEYCLVVGFLVAFVLMWKLMKAPARPATVAAGRAGAARPGEWFQLDQSARYHPSHSWARQDGDVVRVGMDDFAHKLLGVADNIHLPEVGTHVRQGESAWNVEVRSKPIEMRSPIEGEVVEINHEAVRSPGVATDDPYGNGWLFAVRPAGSGGGLSNLLTGRFARAWLDETVHMLRERMSGNLGMALQDGGAPVSGFAMGLSLDDWEGVAVEFLSGEDLDKR